MNADESTRASRRKTSRAAIGLILGFILFFALIFVGPLVFGPRGDLLALLVEWLIELVVSGLFALICCIAWSAGKTALRWVAFLGIPIFGLICLFGVCEAVLCAVDLACPFTQRQVVIAKTYYESPQTGRGAMPETGGWHIVTTGGDDYSLRASGDGKHLQPGKYNIRLSRFKKILMSADPAP